MAICDFLWRAVSARLTLGTCHSPDASEANERCATCRLIAYLLDLVEAVAGDEVVVATEGNRR